MKNIVIISCALIVGLMRSSDLVAQDSVLVQNDTASVASAKDIFVSEKCNSCHSIEVVGLKKKANQKPPDLSDVGTTRSAEWIFKYLKKEEAIDGQKHLKKFKGDDESLTLLAKWLESLKSEKKE